MVRLLPFHRPLRSSDEAHYVPVIWFFDRDPGFLSIFLGSQVRFPTILNVVD